MTKIIDKHYELLTRLYLRLKGYVTSNLILHSDSQGNLKSEVDIIAVRMPYHRQEDRAVNVPDYLQCSDSQIEIIIGDVKNTTKIAHVEFNKGLRKDRESIRNLINWLGIYGQVTDEHVEKFERNLNLHRNKHLAGFAEFDEDLPIGKFKLKFTFFCPSMEEWNGSGFKYIDGKEMIEFCWECLNETKQIPTCSRRYDFGQWNDLERHVRFFKECEEKATVKDFEEYFDKLNRQI